MCCDRAGETITAEHHFRASRMALWLDLIPKLHRADGHDNGFDQLDNADDDDRESANIDRRGDVGPPRPGSDHAWAVPTAATSTPATYSARKLFLRSPAPPPTSTRRPAGVNSRPANADDGRRRTGSTMAPRAAFVATLAIGCLALVVNCVIFVVVYRRRVDLKRLPLPSTDDYAAPSPSVNVVASAKTSSSADGRCADGVVPHHGQQGALYVATDRVDDPGGRQDTHRPSLSPRHRSTPPPPPPPPPTAASSRQSSHSPRRVADGCLLRRSADHANHVTSIPRTTPPASDVWVQLTTSH